jgi:hypothetical protein
MKNMKKSIIHSLFLILVVLVTSCELPDNIDPKNAKAVSPEALFTNVELALINQLGSTNVNENISRLLVQYQSEVTYVTESRYNFVDRQIPDAYSGAFYRDVLMNLKDLKRILDERNIPTDAAIGQKKNQLAMAEIWAVYAYQVLVDAFGNVPYTQALMGSENSRPAYDDAFTIYKDLVVRLSDAIADLDEGFDSFGEADILYNGDIALWRKFAATLKLRIGMRLADVPGSTAGTIITQAINTGVFENEQENAILTYIGIPPNNNSYYTEFVLNARKDFCPTNTLVELMDALNDPRRAVWFTEYPAGSGTYLGLPYGRSGARSYRSFSHFADAILFDPKYPVIISDYVEVEFLLAEAAERSLYGVPADAAAHYNNAVLASMKYWGVSDADAAAYLAKPAVAYATAAGSYKQKIGTQKWLGLFDRGIEAWAEWRRLDYPVLTAPEGMTYADIPMRMPYPFNENKMNKANYEAASAAIGGDEATTKLFWDRF